MLLLRFLRYSVRYPSRFGRHIHTVIDAATMHLHQQPCTTTTRCHIFFLKFILLLIKNADNQCGQPWLPRQGGMQYQQLW